MCAKKNTNKLNDRDYVVVHNNNNQNETSLRRDEDIYQIIQQLYDECDFENCLEAINKVLSDFSNNSEKPATHQSSSLTCLSYQSPSQAAPHSSFFAKKRSTPTLPQQLEDIVIKKGYCLFRLKQFGCLENKILSRYSHLPRIQRLHLLYLFETKNFYKVLEILSRNTSNNIEHQKMRVDSLFELNRYQECLDALKPLSLHLKRCVRLSYIKAVCLQKTGNTNEYITLATKLIGEEKLNSNFIRKLLKGVLNTYMQENPMSTAFMQNYCALFSCNHQKYLKNANKYEKYHTMYSTLIQRLKEQRSLLIDKAEKQKYPVGYHNQKVNVDQPTKCYICLGEFPVAFSLCRNLCENFCISCIQTVSHQCVKCIICKAPYI